MKKNSMSNESKIGSSEELKILRKIVNITNSEIELDHILKEVVVIVSDMTKADSVFVYLYDDVVRQYVLMASKLPHKKELGNVYIKAGEGITGWVAQENRPVAISKKAYQDPRFLSFDVLPEDDYEAFLSVPLSFKKRIIGVINVQHKKVHEYGKNMTDMIAMIAKQISGEIANAQMYEETKKKALQFDSLIKVSRSITSQGYLDEILGLIVVVTAEMLNSKICSIMLYDQKKNELAIHATQSMSSEYKKKPNVKVDQSISGVVLLRKEPMAIYDVTKEKKYGFRELAIKENLTSMLVVPMVVKDQAIGVISVYTKRPHTFTQEEIDALQMVANQAAVAIENTNLLADAMKAKEALETRKIVERAKGILMEMNGLSEKAAHRLIHKKSMDSCKTMKEIAESIILMEEFKK